MNKTLVAYLVLGVLGAALAAFNQELGAGAVPIPAQWLWIGPILGAALVAACAGLDSVRTTLSRDLGTTVEVAPPVQPPASNR